MIGVFIDGPVAGDVRPMPPLPPDGVWRVAVPERVTVCDCEPDGPEIVSHKGPETFEYHVIAHGPRVALLALEGTDEQLLRKLDTWMASDMSSVRWERHCRDRRAFV